MVPIHYQRYLLVAAGLAILAIPFIPLNLSHPIGLYAQNEGESEEPPAHPECTYFTNLPQYSVRGPAESQRVELPDGAVYQSSSAGAQTEEVTRALSGMRDGKAVAFANHWLSRIDYHIFSLLKQKNVPPANLTNDAEFLRRVTLDLTGRIPTAEQVMQFAASTDPAKRANAIDRLLNSPEWVDRWTMWFGDLLKNNIRSTQVVRYQQGRDAFYQWVKSSLEQNKPYNQFVTELITASGDSFQLGPVNFIVGGTMTMGPAQDTYDRQWVQTATMFLGLKSFDCLLCHDGAGHLDTLNFWGSRITRAQAWSLAAYFSRTRITRSSPTAGSSYVVQQATTGAYNLNTTSGNRPARQPSPAEGIRSPMMPRYLFSGRQAAASDNFREKLAQEVTSDFQFARATVNYIWAHFFGVGIVDPPDSFDLSRLDPRNPPPEPWTLQPSHPQLLEELARSFINSNYSLKALMREICNSQAYQLSSQYAGTWNPAYERFYARHLVRRLHSEELHDAMVQSSGVPNNLAVAGWPNPVPWAMQLPDTNEGGGTSAFLNDFLRGDRDENPRRGELSVTQALDLMNDNFVIQRVRGSASGRLNQLLASGINNAQLVEALYLNVLSRYPTPTELTAGVQALQSGNRAPRAQDLLWSLYNKVDFIFNY